VVDEAHRKRLTREGAEEPPQPEKPESAWVQGILIHWSVPNAFVLLQKIFRGASQLLSSEVSSECCSFQEFEWNNLFTL